MADLGKSSRNLEQQSHPQSRAKRMDACMSAVQFIFAIPRQSRTHSRLVTTAANAIKTTPYRHACRPT